MSATAQMAGVQSSKTITSTYLRKYIATVAEVLNLNSTEIDRLASHFGHDVSVHRRFYHLQEEHIEVSKI